MRLSLVIPCYNESKSLPSLLERCAKVTAGRDDVEVILVDNGSTDESPAVLKELLPKYDGVRSIRVEVNQGYGFGILSGLREGTGEILAWTHADLQTDPYDAIRGLDEFTDDNTFVKGNRYGRPKSDVFFTWGMAAFETVLLRKPMWDVNAQPTMFPKTFFDAWKNPPDDFALDLYAYYQARVAGMKVKRFPVRFAERQHGQSSWNVDWSAKKKFIKRTMKFSFEMRRSLKAGGKV